MGCFGNFLNVTATPTVWQFLFAICCSLPTPKTIWQGEKKAISKCLAKLTWQNPKLWTQLYLPQFFSRTVSGPALLVARVSSSRHFLRRAPPVCDRVRSSSFPPVRDAAALGTNEGFQVAVESFLPPWTAGRHRSPRFVHCRSPIPVSCQFVV